MGRIGFDLDAGCRRVQIKAQQAHPAIAKGAALAFVQRAGDLPPILIVHQQLVDRMAFYVTIHPIALPADMAAQHHKNLVVTLYEFLPDRVGRVVLRIDKSIAARKARTPVIAVHKLVRGDNGGHPRIAGDELLRPFQ